MIQQEVGIRDPHVVIMLLNSLIKDLLLVGCHPLKRRQLPFVRDLVSVIEVLSWGIVPNMVVVHLNVWRQHLPLQSLLMCVKYVVGPDGAPLTIADLPKSNNRRWVIRKKAEVVAAIRGGLITLDEALERYALSVDEFLNWQRLIDKHGLSGLRATRVQDYRK